METRMVKQSRALVGGGKFRKLTLASFLVAQVCSTSFASTITLNWGPSTGSDVAGYKVYYKADPAAPFDGTGAVQGASPFGVTGQTSATVTGLDPTHPYYFAITAYNSAGLESPYSNLVTIPELTPPVASISYPANNATVSGAVSVTASASDNVGVTKVEFYLNGVLQSTDTTAPYLFSWNTAALAAGSYTLSAKAYDAAGNVGASQNVSVTVVKDTTAPSVALTSPGNNATVSGAVPVTVSAGDDVGVTKVEFYQDGVLSSAGNLAPYSYNWNTSSVADGSHTLSAKAYDAAGNVGQSAIVTVTVNNQVADSTAPVVSAFSLPATASTLAVPISGLTATDNLAVTGYLVSESSAKPAASAAGWSASKPASFSFAGSGARTAYAFAKDAAGNVSAGRSAAVTITLPGTTAPVVSGFSLPATATSLSVPISGLTATDNVAVTGYLVSESSAKPAASAAGWSASKPASFRFAGPGARTAYAFAKDAAGNVSAGRSAAVTITLPDTTAPSTSIASPLSGARIGSSVSISASATDNVAVTKMALYIDNVLQTTYPGNTLAWAWNSRSYAQGAHVIKVTSYDAANNTSSKSVTVYK